jgi:DHA1 family multidrug resistance protein-like MFS transporter
MIEGMGVGPAGSILGAVALALVPMPVLFYYYGKRLREKSKFAPTYVGLSACA